MKRSLPAFRVTLLLVAGLLFGAMLLQRGSGNRTLGADAAPDPAAVERARDLVKVLDELHKAYVVNITATYVRAQEIAPAARITKKVFKHMEEKGLPGGRLIDASGKPVNEENVAKTAFEKAAVTQLKNGKPYYEEIATKGGKPILRAATVVPVVMKQCITCHPGLKEGDLLGALVYEVPIR